MARATVTVAQSQGRMLDGMEYERLSDYTADLANVQRRNAALVTALARHQQVLHDPEMLDMFLSGRQVSGPVQHHVKAAVAAMDTASNLAPSRPMMQALLAAVDRQSVLGQLNAVRVPSTNAVSAAQTGDATAFWVGEQLAKPLSALAFAALALPPRKLACDVAVTDELLRVATGDVLALIERAVVSACASALDVALLDPANAGTANVKPASLTNGVSTTAPLLDFQNQVGQVLGAISGGAPTRPTLIVSLQTALRLSALPNVGTYVRVIVSPAATNKLIAIDADGIAFVDDGGALRIGQPDVQMSDTPAEPSAASTVMISSWQRDQKVIRCERWVNWAKRSDAVAILALA